MKILAKRYQILILTIFLFSSFQIKEKEQQASKQPNILWIVSEDNGPFLGCYGDSLAITPNLDQLAAEGMRYTHAFSNAPVCAPARHTIITGTYASGNGTENMRSNYPLNSKIQFFPSFLRKQGYYTTNRSKQDYNTSSLDKNAWDESSKQAHYSNRKLGQPFFHVVNFGRSHESSIHPSNQKRAKLVHQPETMQLPAYHPDSPEIRDDWAWYYDRISQMDSLVGKVIQELKENNLYEETIIFYYADHGGVLARSKRFLYDSGLHIPFIVRVPEKYQDRFPDYQPQSKNNRLISFVDLAATMLSIVGIDLPDYLDGKPFNLKANQRNYVYGYASRMDERPDMSRAIRDKDYLLIRNFFPEQANGKKITYLWRQKTVQSWKKLCETGNCNEGQMAFWKPKSILEFFDCSKDPDNVVNLSQDKNLQDKINLLDQELQAWMIEERDKGIIHELERRTLPEIERINQMSKEEYRSLLEMAIYLSEGNELPEQNMLSLLNKDNFYQYWALHALLKNQAKLSPSLIKQIQNLRESSFPSVAILANILDHRQSPSQENIQGIQRLLESEDQLIRFYTLHVLSTFHPEGVSSFQGLIETYAQEKNFKFYYKRLAETIITNQD